MSTGHAAYHHGAHRWFTGERKLGGPEAWLIWVLATIFVVWLFAIQTGYAVVSPDIQQTASLTIAQVGLAASIYTWVFALVQFFSGALLDRFGSRPLMAIAVAFVAVGAFLYAGTTTFATLAIAQTVLAIGSSFGFVGAGYLGGKWFDAAKYGLMFGLVQTFASLGSAVGQPLILAALDHMSWQQLLVAFGAFGVLLVVLFVFFVRNPAPEAGLPATKPEGNVFGGIFRDLGKSFANIKVVLSSLLAGASFGAMLAVGTLWGPRIMEARGAETDFATILTALAWLGLAVGAPLVNVVSDRWRSRKWPAVVGLLLQALAIALVIYLPAEGQGAALVLMFAIGFFAGAHMLGFTIAGEAVPGSLIGSASAIVNGVCFIIGGLLTSIPSALLPDDPALADFQAALWLLPAVVVAGAVAAVLIPEKRTVTATA
ncbi:MFS transporter [Microbacterium terricola]|uniref:MFS transporter n=1 Tax=Microbacterium terricola TaxID=344163 RepID=A0ABM8DWY2_9MICO|nr:MFS transporter [Microbacterium terricola]UYK39151.1 MFS transporter [Microbacterium terricola]BDV30134.1 MFS transporter [Microbacterium terricola]